MVSLFVGLFCYGTTKNKSMINTIKCCAHAWHWSLLIQQLPKVMLLWKHRVESPSHPVKGNSKKQKTTSVGKAGLLCRHNMS